MNIHKGNFDNWCSGELSKIGLGFCNKVILKLMQSKIVKTKKRAPLLVFFNEKKNEKDWDDFCHRK